MVGNGVVRPTWSRLGLWGAAMVVFGVTSAAATACSDSGSTTAAKCPKDNPECKELATVASGKEAVQKRQCTNCHGNDMSGSTTPLPDIPPTALGETVELYPPNLTSDETGAAPPDKGGHWTDDALALAIRKGIDDESQTLCPQMKHFSEMSDFEVYSIVLYLRSLPPVKREVPRSVCPPTKTKEQQAAGP